MSDLRTWLPFQAPKQMTHSSITVFMIAPSLLDYTPAEKKQKEKNAAKQRVLSSLRAHLPNLLKFRICRTDAATLSLAVRLQGSLKGVGSAHLPRNRLRERLFPPPVPKGPRVETLSRNNLDKPYRCFS